MGYNLKPSYTSIEELETKDKAISVLYGRQNDSLGGNIVPISVGIDGKLLIGSPLVLSTDNIDIGDVVGKGITDPLVVGLNPTVGEKRIGLHRVGDAAAVNTDLHAQLTWDPRMTFTAGKLNVDTSVVIDDIDIGDVNIKGKSAVGVEGHSYSGFGPSTTTAGTETFDISVDGAVAVAVGPLAVNVTGAAIAADMQAKAQAATGTAVECTFSANGTYVFHSPTLGAASSVVITNAAGGADTNLLLGVANGGVENSGVDPFGEGKIAAVPLIDQGSSQASGFYALSVQDERFNFTSGSLNVTTVGSGTIFAEATDSITSPAYDTFADVGSPLDITGFQIKSFVLKNTGANACNVRAFVSVDGGLNYDIPILASSNLNPGGVVWIDEDRAFTHFKWQVERNVAGDTTVVTKGFAE